MLRATVVQFNQLSDVDTESRAIVEAASNMKLEDLSIDDVNDFLNGLYLFHKEADEAFWKSLS